MTTVETNYVADTDHLLKNPERGFYHNRLPDADDYHTIVPTYLYLDDECNDDLTWTGVNHTSTSPVLKEYAQLLERYRAAGVKVLFRPTNALMPPSAWKGFAPLPRYGSALLASAHGCAIPYVRGRSHESHRRTLDSGGYPDDRVAIGQSYLHALARRGGACGHRRDTARRKPSSRRGGRLGGQGAVVGTQTARRSERRCGPGPVGSRRPRHSSRAEPSATAPPELSEWSRHTRRSGTRGGRGASPYPRP